MSIFKAKHLTFLAALLLAGAVIAQQAAQKNGVLGDTTAAAQGWTMIERGALLIDVRSDAQTGKEEIQVRVDRQRARQYGFSTESVANAVATAMRGQNLRRLVTRQACHNLTIGIRKGKISPHFVIGNFTRLEDRCDALSWELMPILTI